MRRWLEGNSLILALFLVFAAIAVRFVHLGADTPYGLSSNIGLYVDEGYKTLAPRNLVLFGGEQWHPQDDYPGWVAFSPITQYSFYTSFQVFGTSVESARATSVIWFFLLLLAYVAMMNDQYSGPVFLLGLVLLSVECVLFFFTRVALFEIVIVSLMYSVLFLVKRLEREKPWLCIGITVIMGLVVLYGVKRNASLVLAPALVGMMLVLSVRKNWMHKRVLLVAALCAFTGAIVVLAAKLGYKIPFGLSWGLMQIDFFPVTAILERLLVHPLLLSDPVLVILTYLCLVDLLLNYPNALLRSFYLCSLVSIVVLGTGMLALIGVNHLRFYIPVLPAYILIVVEWWNQQYAHQVDG